MSTLLILHFSCTIQIMDEIPIDLPTNEPNEVRCQYRFKRGREKGNQCIVKKIVSPEEPYCLKHWKMVVGKSDSKLSTPIPSPKVQSPKPQAPRQEVPVSIPVQEPSLPPIPNLPIPEEDPNIDYIYLDSPDKPIQQSKPKKVPEKEDTYSDQSEIAAEKPKEDTDALERQIYSFYQLIPTLATELPYESRGDATAEEWLRQIDKHICQKSGDSAVLIGFKMVTGLIENVGVSRGYKLNGYSNLMVCDPEVQNLLHLIKLRNLNRFQEVSPEMVLFGLCITSAMSLHAIGGRPDLNSSPGKTEPERGPVYKE